MIGLQGEKFRKFKRLARILRSNGGSPPARLTSEPTGHRNGQILYGTFSAQKNLDSRNLESGEERRLTAHTDSNRYPRFSPDGKRLAHVSTRTGNWEIFVLGIEWGHGPKTHLTPLEVCLGTDPFRPAPETDHQPAAPHPPATGSAPRPA